MRGFTTEDINRFLAGSLPEDSPEFEQIVHDFVENRDGPVWRYLLESAAAEEGKLEDVFTAAMMCEGPELAGDSSADAESIEQGPGTIAEMQRPSDEHEGDRSFVQDETIRQEFEAIIGPYQAGEQSLDNFNVRHAVEHVASTLLGVGPYDRETWLRICDVGAAKMSQFIVEQAQQSTLKGPEDANRDADTVALGALQTNAATAQSHPQIVLHRRTRLAELREVNARQHHIYMLSTFAGRTREEISALLNISADEVTEDLDVATIEVCAE